MAVRSKPYTLQDPLDIEALDEMLDILFQDTRNGNLSVAMTQLTGTLPVTSGGTGLSTIAQGDLLYGSAANTLARLAKDANVTRYLSNTGTSNNPAWAQVALSTGVSGDLPFANLTQGSALSVLGVTGNATADHASIAAGTDHQVLRRSGTALAFGAVNLAQADAVTGELPVNRGGTGLATLTANRIPYGNGTSAFQSASGFTFDGTTLTIPGQIAFPAAQAASANANTLDDYEEGTWTPVLTFGGGSTGITYAFQDGKYTKIGDFVACSGLLQLTSNGTSTGDAIITGLPFTVFNAAGNNSSTKISWSAFTGGSEFGLQVIPNTSTMYIVYNNTGTNTIAQETNTSDTAVLVMYICFKIT